MLESLSIWWYSRLSAYALTGYGGRAAKAWAEVKTHPVQTISREVQLVISCNPSETARRTSQMRDEDTVRTSWRHEEAGRNDRPASRGNSWRGNRIERNSLSGKFRPARMAQRSGRCLDERHCEFVVPVKMPVTRDKTERPRAPLLYPSSEFWCVVRRIGGRL